MADKFGSSFSFQKGSDLIHDFICTPCEKDKLNTEAGHFCKDCGKYYCDKCLSFHSKILSDHKVLGRADVSKWESEEKKSCIEYCGKHGNKFETFCEDHRELCCSVCVSVTHRFCNSISHIPDIAKGIRGKIIFKQLPGSLKAVRDKLMDLMDLRQMSQEDISDAGKNTADKIKAFRKEINQYLDKAEKLLLEELDALTKSLSDDLRKDTSKREYINEAFNQLLDAAESQAKETTAFIALKISQEVIASTETLIGEMENKQVAEISFEFNKDLAFDLSKPYCLGEICLKGKNVLPKKTSIAEKGELFRTVDSKMYKVKMDSDKQYVCAVTAVCELPNGDILITDNNNKKIKLLDTQYKLKTSVSLTSSPSKLCHIANNEVAVSMTIGLNYCRNIHFYDIAGERIQLLRECSLQHDCIDMAHNNDQLYIATKSEVLVYTVNGKILKRLYEDKNNAIRALAILANESEIALACENAIITLDIQSGQTLLSFHDSELRRPSSIHVSGSGCMFVCGFTSEKVLQLDMGQKRFSVLAGRDDGIRAPQSLWFSSRTSSLIVAQLTNSILVMKLA